MGDRRSQKLLRSLSSSRKGYRRGETLSVVEKHTNTYLEFEDKYCQGKKENTKLTNHKRNE